LRGEGTDDVGRALGDDRGARAHHDLRNLRLRGNRRNCESDWCGEAARKNGDIVIDDQFLSYPFRLVRYRGIVTDDQLDPLASDVRAVLLNKQLRSCNHFIAFYGERTGHWNQEAHLDRCLRLRRHFPGAYKSTGGSERFQKTPPGLHGRTPSGLRVQACLASHPRPLRR
jgi:hypothetical protein